MLSFDFSPLSGPVDKQAVATLKRDSLAEKVRPNGGTDVFMFRLSIIGFLATAALVLFIDVGTLSLFTKVAYTLGMGGISIFLLLTIPFWAYRLVIRWTEFYRVKRFAEVNGMTYAGSESKPTWNSLLFDKTADKYHTTSVFTATREPVFEAGNYTFEVWVEKKLTPVPWGYIVTDLGRPVAPIVLRSRSRASDRRWGPGVYSRNPVISLGSDIDRDFLLYCPGGAEADARSIFTPELIAALRRLGKSIDAEITGNHLFVYSTRRFAFPRPQAVKDVFAVISLVSALARTA